MGMNNNLLFGLIHLVQMLRTLTVTAILQLK